MSHGPDDLELAAQRLLQHGVDGEFIDGDIGHGKAFRFTMPGGHRLELVWEVDRFVAPADQRSVYPDRPQKQVARNATVRRLDHCTVFTSKLLADRRVMTEALRFRHMDTTVTPDGEEIFSTVTSGAAQPRLRARGAARIPRRGRDEPLLLLLRHP